MYDGDESDGPKGTFEIYKAEADSLFKQGEYRKSIESYTTVCICHWNLVKHRPSVPFNGFTMTFMSAFQFCLNPFTFVPY